MLLLIKATTTSATRAYPSSPPLLLVSLSKPSFLFLSKSTFAFPRTSTTAGRHPSIYSSSKMSWLNKLGFGTRSTTESSMDSSIAQGPDDDLPAPGQQFAQFGAGCFWGVELAFQRVPGVTKTEVGYSQGYLHKPSYEDICTGTTNHSEVVRVQYDPKECTYDSLLDVFWARHDPTTLNRQVRLLDEQLWFFWAIDSFIRFFLSFFVCPVILLLHD